MLMFLMKDFCQLSSVLGILGSLRLLASRIVHRTLVSVELSSGADQVCFLLLAHCCILFLLYARLAVGMVLWTAMLVLR